LAEAVKGEVDVEKEIEGSGVLRYKGEMVISEEEGRPTLSWSYLNQFSSWQGCCLVV
jgi:hypothetical protein